MKLSEQDLIKANVLIAQHGKLSVPLIQNKMGLSGAQAKLIYDELIKLEEK